VFSLAKVGTQGLKTTPLTKPLSVGSILSNDITLCGRLWVQTILLLGEGVLVLVFANSNTLSGSIIVMIFFSALVQAAEGSSYGIVLYVDPPATRSIAGVVLSEPEETVEPSVLDWDSVSKDTSMPLSLWVPPFWPRLS
jgi:hypothetical protein